jgi:3-isopropylmalate dehydrogenase
MSTIAILAGDGIGVEITAAAVRVLSAVRPDLHLANGDVGAGAIRKHGSAFPEATSRLVEASEAVLFGSVGDGHFTGAASDARPEYAILELRRRFDLYANVRPARIYEPLIGASPLKAEIARGMDLVVVREATSGLYFGKPKAQLRSSDGSESAVDTCTYAAAEIERVVRFAFELARKRRFVLTSIDKENVLETSRLWRRIVDRLSPEYGDVRVEHLLADNATMQLMRRPRDFDVIVTDNMFGDLLSDEAAMISGSIGNLPSATLNASTRFGVYEPIGGTAPDIAGKNLANPTASILCAALLCRHSLDDERSATIIERAVEVTFRNGVRTADVSAGGPFVSTEQFTSFVLEALEVSHAEVRP